MNASESLRDTVKTLLNNQIQAVLATQHQQQPYTSLMAFAVTPDLRRIVFATARATQKYANLRANPRASLLIDNRCNRPEDYRCAMAVSAQGVVREVGAIDRAGLLQLYLDKHPTLRDFVTDDASTLLQLEVDGLSNVDKRLAALYHRTDLLKVIKNERYFEVNLKIPLS